MNGENLAGEPPYKRDSPIRSHVVHVSGVEFARQFSLSVSRSQRKETRESALRGSPRLVRVMVAEKGAEGDRLSRRLRHRGFVHATTRLPLTLRLRSPFPDDPPPFTHRKVRNGRLNLSRLANGLNQCRLTRNFTTCLVCRQTHQKVRFTVVFYVAERMTSAQTKSRERIAKRCVCPLVRATY